MLQESARTSPIALQRSLRTAQHFDDVGQFQTGEESHLDQGRQRCIHILQRLQCLVQGQHVLIAAFRHRRERGGAQGLDLHIASTAQSSSCAHMIDEYLSHGLGGNGKVMRPVTGTDGAVIGQLEKGLVHQRGGVHDRIATQLGSREATQVAVEHGEQALRGSGIAFARPGHQFGDFHCCAPAWRVGRLRELTALNIRGGA